jgi:diguanylate cyclase (GGDEF)-like protein
MRNTPSPPPPGTFERIVWLNVRRNLLGSALGRRVLAHYIGAVLVPIAALALLVCLQVPQTLRPTRDAELAQSARAYGVALRDRLLLLDSALREASALASPGAALDAALASGAGKQFESVVRLAAGTQRTDPSGMAAAPGQLDAASRDALAQGKTVLRLSDEDSTRIVLLRKVASVEPAVLAAVVNPAYLSGDPEALPRMTELCVVSDGRAVIGCARRPPEAVLAQLTAAAPARPTHTRQWRSGDDNFYSDAALVDLQSRFSARNWTVIASQSETYALAPARSFQSLLLAVAAVATALAVLLAAWHIRRVVDPLHRLLVGMRRLTEHDFSPQVPVSGHDEIAQLSRAFNEMARNLGMNFVTLNVLSQIDKTILSKADVSDVAKSALKCVRYITSAHVVILGLYESEAADSMRIYVLRRDGLPKIRIRFPLTAELKLRIPESAAASCWNEEPPLPEHIRNKLKEEDRVHKYWAQPVTRGDRIWGVIVLGHPSELALTQEQRDLLSGVDDRLEVAFSSLERDRKLQTMAHADPLTGLPNRASMVTLLAQELANAKRDQTSLGVLFLDLDRFKRTNDTLGHAAGDALLRQAASRIRENLRAGDTVARPGGDEFTVLLGKLASARDAGLVARQLIKALSRPFEVDGHTIYVGASVGIALYPQDGITGTDLLKKADSAMYRAKDTGRNRFVYYEESMNVEAQRRAALDHELRQAFDRNELILHYQPQIDVRTGLVCAAEALIRWQHPREGLLLPTAFIPFAEESGLIDAIGSWVLKEACLQHQRWRNNGVPIPRIAVNVSHRQLVRSNFLRTVHYLLNLARMPPGTLEIEVTESMFVQGSQASIDSLHALTEAGVRIAIDDFGTGYSSFGYLKTLPAAILKLDQSFLEDAPDNPDAATIVAAMINMAHTLRKEVVAEGVERMEQYRFLEQLGCEKVQGFLFAEALSADEAARFAIERLQAAQGTQSNPDLETAEST